MIVLEKIYKEVALKLGLNESDVKEAYQLYWNFFRKSIEALPLKEDLTKEEFSKLNIETIEKLSKLYHSTNVELLAKYMRRHMNE